METSFTPSRNVAVVLADTATGAVIARVALVGRGLLRRPAVAANVWQILEVEIKVDNGYWKEVSTRELQTYTECSPTN